MGKLSEHLAHEQERTDEHSLRTLYLYRVGQFFRAYDWSAWLFVQHLKPGIRIIKTPATSNNPEHVFLGFPTRTIEQYVHSEHIHVSMTEEDVISIELDETYLPYEISYDSLCEAYNRWYADIPLAEKKNVVTSKSAHPSEGTPAVMGIFDVMREILQYSVEQHSPLQAQEFLTQIKAKLIKML